MIRLVDQENIIGYLNDRVSKTIVLLETEITQVMFSTKYPEQLFEAGIF